MTQKIWNKIRGFFPGSYNNRVNCPLILQTESYKCGATSLAMILAYYKKFVSIEQLREVCDMSRDGSSAASLIRAARKLGLEARGYRAEYPKDLDRYKPPLILFWEFNHFLVYTGRHGDEFYLNDPAIGRRVVSWQQMDKSFTGVLITFKKTPKFVAEGKAHSFLGTILPRLKGIRPILLFIFLAGLFLVPCNLLTSNLLAVFLDNFITAGYYSWGMPLLLTAILTLIFTLIFVRLQQLVLIRGNLKLEAEFFEQFLYHLLRLPLSFYSSHQSGELVNRMWMNEKVAYFISKQFSENMLGFLAIFFYGALLLYYDLLLGAYTIVTAIFIIIIMRLEMITSRQTALHLQQDIGRLSGVSTTGIMLIETLKANGGENAYFSYWSGIETNVTMGRQKMNLSAMRMNVVPVVLIALNTAVIVCIGAFRVLSSSMSSGTLLAFQLVAAFFFLPISTLVGLSTTIQEVDVATLKLDEVLQIPEDSSFSSSAVWDWDKQQGKLSGAVELRNVTFGYYPEQPAVTDFSLSIRPGERIALVGASGSGKSTVTKLLTGLYQPWQGEILFDGKKLNEYPPEIIAASLAVVDQEFFLFRGTVFENLSMRNRSISIATVTHAAKDAVIHDEISQRPSGYFSEVYEDGSNFSGGQRQRLELARALTVNPRILILDEATSALDPVIEERIDRNLRRRGCTIILVAHRLSTIRDADRIMVMDKGRICESGTHDELLAQNGKYAELIRSM